MFVSTRSFLVEWSDCDPDGFMHHYRYFEIFDISSIWLFRCATGMTKLELTRHYNIVGFPLVETGAKILIPSVYGEEMIMEASVSEFGRASFTVSHRLLKQGELAVEGHEKRVWVAKDPERPGAIKAIPVPDDFIEKLSREPTIIA